MEGSRQVTNMFYIRVFRYVSLLGLMLLHSFTVLYTPMAKVETTLSVS